MNHKLLNKIKKVILNNPKAFNMHHFVSTRTDCGTSACIAGHAMLLSGYLPTTDDTASWIKDNIVVDVIDGAQKELGLSSDQAMRLFYYSQLQGGISGWPFSLADRYRQGDKTAAVEMIELIQAEDKEGV